MGFWHASLNAVFLRIAERGGKAELLLCVIPIVRPLFIAWKQRFCAVIYTYIEEVEEWGGGWYIYRVYLYVCNPSLSLSCWGRSLALALLIWLCTYFRLFYTPYQLYIDFNLSTRPTLPVGARSSPSPPPLPTNRPCPSIPLYFIVVAFVHFVVERWRS